MCTTKFARNAELANATCDQRPKLVQNVVRDVANQCGSHSLALRLPAGAAKRNAIMINPPNDRGLVERPSALDDLGRNFGAQKPTNSRALLRTYTMSIGRQSELAQPVLAMMCRFPTVDQVPKKLVYVIWCSTIESTTSDGQDTSSQSRDGLETRLLGNGLDLHWTTSTDLGASRSQCLVPGKDLLAPTSSELCPFAAARTVSAPQRCGHVATRHSCT